MRDTIKPNALIFEERGTRGPGPPPIKTFTSSVLLKNDTAAQP
jgi:hypothetical protein